MTDLEKKILESLKTPLSEEKLLKELPELNRDSLYTAISGLIDAGLVMSTKQKKLVASSSLGYKIGTYLSSGKGYGFVDTGEENDLFIPPRKESDAWHGDLVMVRLSDAAAPKGKGKEGSVIKIIREGSKTLTGKFVKKGAFAYVIPDQKQFQKDIQIEHGGFLDARNNDKVVVSVLSRNTYRGRATGKIIQILGKNGEITAAVNARLYANEIIREFSDNTISQAKELPDNPLPDDYNDRLDLRKTICITIDGDEAKDFDDAVSLIINEKGNYSLGVHIADVSHYVTENSPLDTDAYARGTSVYFADQVIPMLPVELSNGLCSLNPHVDRLCFSVLMEMDKKGAIIGQSFHKSVICSKERMTYNNCNRMFMEEKDAALCERYQEILPMLQSMRELSNLLRERRNARGALDLDLPESKIICDKNGLPVDIIPRPRGTFELVIEDFMLAANETVAEYLFWADAANIYRVHENPDPVKISSFKRFANVFGYQTNFSKELLPAELQKVLNQAKGKPEERSVSSLLLRSLPRAKYSEKCLGHYGLAAKYYCHFTSPIRRYPDLVTHRMLQYFITGTGSDKQNQLKIFCARAAEQSSTREFAADTAERDIEKVYKAAYMQKFIGDEFDAVISGVLQQAFFVELENSVEGMVLLNQIEESFTYDEQMMTLTGDTTKQVFTIGRKVKVRCVSADIDAGEVDFELI